MGLSANMVTPEIGLSSFDDGNLSDTTFQDRAILDSPVAESVFSWISPCKPQRTESLSIPPPQVLPRGRETMELSSTVS